MGRKPSKNKPSKKEVSKKRPAKDEDYEVSEIFGIELKQETKQTILIIFLFIFSLFFILAGFGAAGVAGDFTYTNLRKLFGVGYALLPIILMLVGLSIYKAERQKVGLVNSIASILFLLSGLGFISIVAGTENAGILGKFSAWPFIKLFDIYIAALFLLALVFVSLILLFEESLSLKSIGAFFRKIFGKKEKSEEDLDEDEEDVDEFFEDEEEYEEDDEEEDEKEEPMPVPQQAQAKEDKEGLGMMATFKSSSEYKAPPLSLLNKNSDKVVTGDIKANSVIIKRTLANFGIDVEMDEVTVGPTVTRYSLKPAQGVRLAKISALSNELRLALAAKAIRIEAPIPGQSLVGVEIPNQVKALVDIRSLISDEVFQKNQKPLTVALGKSVSGKAHYANVAKMPHLIIAGATGAGKSVAVHALITSLLYRNGPENLRFIMIDPKRVELTLYNSIPHLLTPVITEPKKAIIALKWAVGEMERRYDILEGHAVRDIESYNKKKEKDEEMENIPYIVVIVDELADIMMSYPRELEAGIVRLAQMSRAVGIHLILSTQRPSVNVITGLIKANVPARIALQVSSQIDSRTILDSAGAEKLLGAGDMLYSSGDMNQPERIQCAFISEDEVKKVAAYLKNQYKDELPDDINLSEVGISKESTIFDSGNLSDGDQDDLFEEARAIVIGSKKASTSYLQRRLKIGYSRAARLIDELEEAGVVGEANGSKPREILVNNESNLPNDYEKNDNTDLAEDDEEGSKEEY
ncbi:MAG: DNA translocase FtsK [Candidatus Paceibacterota bacterium]